MGFNPIDLAFGHMDALQSDNERLKAENAKLRTFLGGGSIVTDYWKDEDGTMHVLTTDGEHTYEYMRGGLADENAKLRELARDMLRNIHGCTFHHSCGSCDFDECIYETRARELGIEVNE